MYECEPLDDHGILYKYQNKLNIRYYTEGEYVDHGRIIYKSLPIIGDVIHPFLTNKGPVNWKVTEVKIPENDHCIEIYFEDVDKK